MKTILRSHQVTLRSSLILAISVLAMTGWFFFGPKTNGISNASLLEKGYNVNTRFLQRPNGTLAYDDRGSGELVLLVPGLGDLRQEYRYLVPELLAAGYRVVTVDLRGHGESSAGWDDYGPEAVGSDLLALIDTLDAGPATIVGTSFAASAAVWAAAEKPEALSRLVLIGPFVRDHGMSFTQRTVMNVMFSGPWKVRAWDWYYGTLYPTEKPQDFDSYRAALRANLNQPGRFEALKAMVFASKANIEAKLRHVRAPSLIVMGTKDPDFPNPTEEAQYLSEKLSARVALIPDAGHYPHAEMPQKTAQAILDFLAERKD